MSGIFYVTQPWHTKLPCLTGAKAIVERQCTLFVTPVSYLFLRMLYQCVKQRPQCVKHTKKALLRYVSCTRVCNIVCIFVRFMRKFTLGILLISLLSAKAQSAGNRPKIST
jgi:hypothetical protein